MSTTTSTDGLTREEAAQELDIPPDVYDALVEIGSLTLGRPVRSWSEKGVLVASREDLERVKSEALPRRHAKLAKYDVIRGPDGHWRTLKSAINWAKEWSAKKGRPRLCASLTHLVRLSKTDIAILGGETLGGKKVPVYQSGAWIWLWVIPQDRLTRFANVILAGKFAQPGQRKGWNYDECKTKGFAAPHMLRRWSIPREKGGKGIRELGGEVLDTWRECRVAPNGRVVIDQKVFSSSQLEEVLKLRRERAAEETRSKEKLEDKTELTDLEAHGNRITRLSKIIRLPLVLDN